MKITMYELLGLVKDGKVPKRIIYDKYVYQWNNIIKNYEREIDINTTLNWDYIAIEGLNDEVEILEEEKKIPEKITINDNGTIGFPNGEWTARNMDKAFAMKINSIIDYLKSKGDE